MPVLLNDKRILPAPMVTFGKTPQFADDGSVIGADYTVRFEGTILQNKGNPIATNGASFSSSLSADGWTSTQTPDDDPYHNVGTSDLLISTITKIEQLRNLVSPASGIKVEIVGFNHDQGLKFYGDLRQFDVSPDGMWAKPASYTMEFGCNNFIGPAISGLFPEGSTEDGFNYYVSSVKESWSIQEGDRVIVSTGDFNDIHKTYTISHSVDSKGKRAYNSSGVVEFEPWQQASGYVINEIGLGTGNMPTSLLLGLVDYYVIDRKISESVDKFGGTYAVEETFTYLPTGQLPTYMAYEECSINIENTEGVLKNVAIQGTITGAETGVSTTGINRYTNASNYFGLVSSTLYNRVRQNSGLTWIHPMAKSSTVGRSPNAGQITYAYNYDNRPPNLIPGSVSEDIKVSDTFPGQLFSSTPVIGRSQAILSYLGSRSSYKRSLSISLFMAEIQQDWSYGDVDSSGVWAGVTESGLRDIFIHRKPSLLQSPSFEKIFQSVNPANESGVVKSKVFYDEPQESFDVKTGAYSYSINWTFERE